MNDIVIPAKRSAERESSPTRRRRGVWAGFPLTPTRCALAGMTKAALGGRRGCGAAHQRELDMNGIVVIPAKRSAERESNRTRRRKGLWAGFPLTPTRCALAGMTKAAFGGRRGCGAAHQRELDMNGIVVIPAKRSAERKSSRTRRRKVFWAGFPLTRCALAGMTKAALGGRREP